MKKEYDFWANKQNTPHLDLYTRLIKQICGYTSLNFLLAFIYARFWIKFQYDILFLILSVIMITTSFTKANDPRRQERSLFAVVCEGVIHALCTCAVCFMLSFWILLVIYILEIVHVVIIIKKYYRPNKK